MNTESGVKVLTGYEVIAAYPGFRLYTVGGGGGLAVQARAVMAQSNQGLMRLYAAKSDARLLGAEMCVPAAEHLAHLLALAIGQGLTPHDLLRMPFYHPVLEEGLRSALRELAGQFEKNTSDLAACNAYEAEALD